MGYIRYPRADCENLLIVQACLGQVEVLEPGVVLQYLVDILHSLQYSLVWAQLLRLLILTGWLGFWLVWNYINIID